MALRVWISSSRNRSKPMVVVAYRVNIEVFSLALAHFAQAVSAGPDRHVVLVAGPSPGGIRVGKSSCRRASISSFCRPPRRSCCPANISGRSRTRVIATRRFESRGSSCVAGTSRAVYRSQRTIPSVFAGTRFSDFRPLSGNTKRT